MQLRDVSIILLALLLAAMAMVPMVSANDPGSTLSSSTAPEISTIQHLTVSSDYLNDVKPAKWLPESEMITFVISEKTVGKLNQNKKENLISLPVEFLRSNSAFSKTKSAPTLLMEKTLAKGEKILLIRMPQTMFEQFISNSHDGRISLPANYFYRYYENLDDLYTHIVYDGNTLKIFPSEKYTLKNDLDTSETTMGSAASLVQNKTAKTLINSENIQLLDESVNELYAARDHADRTHPNTNYDYCIGQIKPVSWTLLGSGLENFDLFQEREYKFNSNEEIEIVVKHLDRNGNGDIKLFPTAWRSNAQVQAPPSEWTEFPGYLPIDKNNLPHSYGYHVGFSSGYYTINFQDMETLDWIGQFRITSAPGTSSFTHLSGSSEYRKRSTPTTNSFESTTIERDEWARVVNDAYFQYASNVWSRVTPETALYVSVSPADTNYGRYQTNTYAVYP
ncbi:MAG: hypothetical protein WC586_01770 [Methanoregula sp.]